LRISATEFLEKYRQLLLAQTRGIDILAYWKMKWLIENGEAFYLPEHDCYYLIRNNHLLIYYSPDNRLHLSAQELNRLDCISLPATMYDTIKEQLVGFNVSYGWGLRYDFNYRPKENGTAQYQAVDFNFSDPAHYTKAACIINGNNGGWLNDKNVKKMTSHSAFDPTLWFFVKDMLTQDLAAISISAYDAEVKQTDLDWIYVAPGYQGKGCGRFLIEETIRRCKDKSESICVGGTVEFYRKCGFVDYELWAWAPKEGYQFKAEGIQP
jgi:predicted N-acetyltransferase YhbS